MPPTHPAQCCGRRVCRECGGNYNTARIDFPARLLAPSLAKFSPSLFHPAPRAMRSGSFRAAAECLKVPSRAISPRLRRRRRRRSPPSSCPRWTRRRSARGRWRSARTTRRRCAPVHARTTPHPPPSVFYPQRHRSPPLPRAHARPPTEPARPPPRPAPRSQVVKRRLEVYKAQCGPVEEFYREKGLLFEFPILAGIPETLPRLLPAAAGLLEQGNKGGR